LTEVRRRITEVRLHAAEGLISEFGMKKREAGQLHYRMVKSFRVNNVEGKGFKA
jgi:hypothetical protein